MLVPLVVFGVTVGGSCSRWRRGPAPERVPAWPASSAAGDLVRPVAGVRLRGDGRHHPLRLYRRVRCWVRFRDATEVSPVPEVRDAWLVSIALFIAVNVVVNLLNVIPFLGSLLAVILSPFATFYVLVVATDLWAGGYNAALDERDEPESVGTATA